MLRFVSEGRKHSQQKFLSKIPIHNIFVYASVYEVWLAIVLTDNTAFALLFGHTPYIHDTSFTKAGDLQIF